MIYGTSYFVSERDACRYYRPQGIPAVEVKRKIAEGLIHVGFPPYKAGDYITTIDGGTRYAITECPLK